MGYTTKRKDIIQLFPSHKIESIYFTKDLTTNQNKGSAFVYFDNDITASNVLQQQSNNNLLMIQGRPVQISTPFSNTSSIIQQHTNDNTKKESDKRHNTIIPFT